MGGGVGESWKCCRKGGQLSAAYGVSRLDGDGQSQLQWQDIRLLSVIGTLDYLH
jgi:hypothetical protein